MQTLEYRTIDKSAWGDGPWQSEPDKKQWQDEATGLPCILKRNPHRGVLCGYVGVPPGHPLHGKEYSEVSIDVHGGLTYSDACMEDERDISHRICHVPSPDEPDHVWWFGFDCGHALDLAPARKSLLDSIGVHVLDLSDETYSDAEYRDAEYVADECCSLAKQLAEMR